MNINSTIGFGNLKFQTLQKPVNNEIPAEIKNFDFPEGSTLRVKCIQTSYGPDYHFEAQRPNSSLIRGGNTPAIVITEVTNGSQVQIQPPEGGPDAAEINIDSKPNLLGPENDTECIKM